MSASLYVTSFSNFLNLSLSNSVRNLKSLLLLHSLIITSGNQKNIFFSSKLISLYSSFKHPNLSASVFMGAEPKDTFLWNSVIKSQFSNGFHAQSVDFYLQMRVSLAMPNHFTLPMVVSACAELQDIDVGSNVHGIAIKLNFFDGNCAIGSSFIYMYSKCRNMDSASKVFEEMPIRDVVAWTALIVGYVNNDNSGKGLDCLWRMFRSKENGGIPNSYTIESGLHACGNLVALQEGRCLHCFVVKTGIEHQCLVRSSLLSMYANCESLQEALLAFLESPSKDLVSWTTIISMYMKQGSVWKSLEFFHRMLMESIEPDGITLSCLLLGIGNFATIKQGKVFHGFILRRNYESDLSVCNSLLSMYCKLGSMDSAEKFFNRMRQRHAESWNWMVFGYGKMESNRCLELFRRMQFQGLVSDFKSIATVISACARLGTLDLGRAVHCYMVKLLIHDNISIANSLIGLYGRCGRLEVAKAIFYRMHRDIVSWSTLVGCFASSGHPIEALLLFDQMLLEDMKPNSATLVSVLSACSDLAALNHGERVHNYVKEWALECDVSVGTALVDMYAKCGQLAMSRTIFDSMPEKDVVSWNVMISSYGINGYANDAVGTFKQMEMSGMTPNGVTFLAVLSACGHGGLIEEGLYLFNKMKEHYHISPTLKHYASVIDMLSRSGNLIEAESMLLQMPMSPDGGIWGTLLGACAIHNNVEVGERVAKLAIDSDPKNDGYYVLMSNMYSSVGRWEEVKKTRMMMKYRGVQKRSGWSAIEIGGKFHLFFIGDVSNPSHTEVYMVLQTLFNHMEEYDS